MTDHRNDQDFWYPDKLTGRRVRLRAKPGEAVVTVTRGDVHALTPPGGASRPVSGSP